MPAPRRSSVTLAAFVALAAALHPLAACAAHGQPGGGAPQPPLQDPFGRGINLGNALELRGPTATLPLLVSETDAIGAAFDQVLAWAAANGGPPVFVGEFGAYGAADLDSRVRWTRAVREAAEARGFGWAYWEFAAGFGAYDQGTEAWRPELLGALLGE